MTLPQKQNPGWRAGASETFASGHRFHVNHASAEPLLQRLDGVQKSGNGWRARCPSCGGQSRKLSIAETDGRVLLHDFGGCAAVDVLAAVGLAWADVMPPRTWPESPEERKQARRAIREAGWASALAVLSSEAAIVCAASTMLLRGRALSGADHDRLQVAHGRIAGAREVLR